MNILNEPEELKTIKDGEFLQCCGCDMSVTIHAGYARKGSVDD